MEPLVSILVPCYNSEKWIEDCLLSAINQTWPHKEIIVVDDGSTDSSLRIASKFSSRNITILSQLNCGASSARNRALSVSKGDYIQWLDSDDLLVPDKIARQLLDAQPGATSNVLISGAWGKFFIHPYKAVFSPNQIWCTLPPVTWLSHKMEFNLWMPPAAFLVSRRLAILAGKWDETLCRDTDGEYFSRVLLNSSSVRFVPASKALKRSTLGISSPFTLSEQKLESLIKTLTLHVYRLLSLEDSQRTRRISLSFLQRWAILFYPERMDLFTNLASIATDLGGAIYVPKLRPKYRLIQTLLGFRIAKRAQITAPILSRYLDIVKEKYFISAPQH